MQENAVIIAGMISVAIVIATFIIVFGRLKIEQQKTLRKLLETDDASRLELSKILGPKSQADGDFRRGLLLIVMGFVLTGFLFFFGGIGWILGLMPITVGFIYLFFWTRNADRK
ncbi:MAG: hypothetical protein AAF657_20520 [Acidobacteriota bacterium]